MTASEQPLDGIRSQYFDALAHGRRRHVLDVLSDATAPMALADIAAELAARESNDPGPDHDHGRRVQIDLYHCHVPKLAAAGLVEFDAERRTVRVREARSRELSDVVAE